VLVLAGVGLFAVSLTFPVYTDIDAWRELVLNACDADGPVEGWYDKMDALRTWRHPLMQSGLSLVLAGATLRGLFHFFHGGPGMELRSPASRLTYFALGTGVVFVSWFSRMLSLVIDFERHEFPSCADLFLVPMSTMTYAYVVFFAVCLGTGMILSFGFKILPVRLFVWRKDRPLKSVLVTVPLALVALIIAFLGVMSAWTSAFAGTPAAVAALFLVEATRSVLLGEGEISKPIEPKPAPNRINQ